MDLNYVKKILKLVEESNVNEIELEEKGIRVRITKSANNSTQFYQPPPYVPPPQLAHPPAPPMTAAVPSPAEPAVAPEPEKKYREIKSPIVGTFYRAPAPDAANYIEVGSVVEPGTVLCIIEAMKLMNEIEADVGGKIVKISVENGKPVEYNQVLFLIDTEG